MKKYDHRKIEKKWQKKWEESGSFKLDKDDQSCEKFYVLDMFPYPSGEGLHMGHTESYTASDIFYRFKRMQGFDVLHPQGFDSFGLPAENYAIKTGVHPAETTQKNIANYIRQMKSLGLSYDFEEKIVTSDPSYYHWTQWIFGQFFQNDLVEKKIQKTNWCPSCQTVIANEQVVGGECERCGSEIVQKEIPGWFFKTTDFAQELIDDLEKVDWPEHTKKNQINWIGKSEGTTVKFAINSTDSKEEDFIEVFTTRVDTIFGCTYVVLAPEHPLVLKIKDEIENWNEVEKYLIQAQNKTELDRMEAKEKTGVKIEGLTATNPFNGEKLPVFVADYVIGSYGTGAVMAVPAHDERDWEFAKKYELPIKKVIKLHDEDSENECLTENGILINSEKFSNLSSQQARKKMATWLQENGLGKKQINFRLRDWSVSRQRFWGCPIPIVYSPEGEAKFVGEENLPWTLPQDVDFVPTGVAPLAKSAELKKRTEKIFGQGWQPECDTMDTFVDSSWYFLRYADPKNEKSFCASERLKRWLPVDLYIGGAEHTYMHLLFARFFVKAMKKIGLVDFDEPFLQLRHQGMVLDKNGKKMSKSKGNVVNPDDMIEKFGADSVRLYMMFAAPLEDEVIWNEENIVGVYRFLEKVWDKAGEILKVQPKSSDEKLLRILHPTIEKVTADIAGLHYNTAVSEMMKFINASKKLDLTQSDFEDFLKILSPLAPHICEEIWEMFGREDYLIGLEWPSVKEEYLKRLEIEMPIQVNGKVRAKIFVSADVTEDEAKETALEDENIKKHLEGKEVVKIIFVPERLINIVAK